MILPMVSSRIKTQTPETLLRISSSSIIPNTWAAITLLNNLPPTQRWLDFMNDHSTTCYFAYMIQFSRL